MTTSLLPARLAALGLLSLLSTVPALARADGRPDLAPPTDACAKLEESDRVRPSARISAGIGECLERRGKIASAHARFLEAAQRAGDAHRPDAERQARARAARLVGRLPWVMVVVPASEDAVDLQLTRSGAPLPRGAWNVAEPIDPWTEVTYEARRADGRTFRATVVAEEGRTARVEVRWPAAAAQATPAAPPPAVAARPAANAPSESEPRTAAYVALVAGGLGVALGGYGALQVASARRTVDEHCSADGACDADGLAAGRRGKTYSVVAPIGLGVGALGLGLGTFLVLRGTGAEGRRSAFTVAPTAGAQGGGIVAKGAF